MTVLIIYSTIEGQTGKIARFVETQVKDAGHEVCLVDASDKMAEVSFDGIDKVILAAPVHERRHPREFEVLIASVQKELGEHDSLFLSVSMNAAFPDSRDEAQSYVDEMIMRTGVTPDDSVLVAGAIRPEHYDYYADQVMQHVVLRDRKVDPETKSHEFTNWDSLKAAVDKFVDATADAV